MVIKTEEIIFKSGSARQVSNKPKTVCEIFCYQPDNIEQMSLGSLYIVAELSLVKDCGHLNNLLASLIKREYYLYPERGAIKSFRSALKKANAHLADLAKQGNPEWLSKLHFICASIAKDELLFVQTGQPQAYLARENHLVNLGHRIISDSGKPHPSKIFSSIVTGKIETGDKIVFATPTLTELLSPNGLKQILNSNQSLLDVSDQIDKIAREENRIFPLAILLLKAEDDPPLKQKIHTAQQPRKFITPPIDLKEILR
ncbi:MAG: hypothetical protein CO001_02785 [Candidatus Portnoybacteria bacterium CG_4_8_14_3_um_filter_40_10]|uniref:Uncharacterized protein n=1 Tax=Candidatus Portnoybacteria bacterium CG_4_8_14_3_um_filter_40_10 TaxID=1974801 RepID=A0A2M7II82_9BACT|nr:MAG: hypothetical protein CO001_02785 [Candidatus Portnoybacteria bacterium CG_4_8_14_3_um_filter_40_10]